MNKIFKKWRSVPDSVKSSIAFAFSAFIIKGIAFLVTPIFTRIMEIEDYGIITTYNSWVSIIEIFALLGLTSAGVFNVGLKENKETRDKYISTCLGLCNVCTIIVFLFIFVLKCILGEEFWISNDLIIVMFIHFLFNPAQIFWITRQRYEYKYKLATLVTVATVILSQILSLIGVLKFKDNPVIAKILGNELGILILTLPIFIVLIKKGKTYIDFNSWKNILILALPLIPHYLAQHVMSGADKIMISDMVNSGDAAIYGVVSNIGMVGTILWSAINGSLIPFTFENIESKNYGKIKKTSNSLMIFYAIMCVGIILIAPEVLKILAPSEYYVGIYCVPPIVMVVFLQALYNLYANVEFYYKKTKRIAIATIIATIVNLGLNYLIIPKYSFVGAAYTTLISYIVLIIIHYLGYKSCMNEEVYDNKFIFIIVVSLLFISILSNILYCLSDLLRYACVVVILLTLFIKKDKIILLIKQIK